MDTRQMLQDTAEKMFADHCDKPLLDRAEQGEYPKVLHDLIHENGFQQLAMPESGVELADALSVLRVAGQFALPLPLAEMLLVNRWLGGDGTSASIGTGDARGAGEVPWGRAVEAVVSLSADGTAHLLTDLTVEPGANLAGEPRDRVRAGTSTPLVIEEDALGLLALTRAVMMAGGLTRALALSLDYVSEREQFGRPISKFQAIQHHMAVMAAETAAAIRAADAGLAGIGTDRMSEEVAAAKARVGEAVGVVAELAHQVHGAMGYTHEHQLHHTTRRLWAWRDEYGTERIWQERLGRALAARVATSGDDALWSFIATRG